MPETLPDAREIVLDGSVNFRDLGGLTTTDGRVVRAGRVFRSDALHALSTIDLDRLAGLHIATLVDLRSTGEADRSGPSPLVARGTRLLHTPIMDPDPAINDEDVMRRMSEMRMEELYAGMLANAQARFGEIFQALAEPETLPAVIHCAAGKDRTGVTVALLLRILGVPDDAIVLDYALTDRNMVRLFERLEREGYVVPGAADASQYPAHVRRAAPETMSAFLATLDDLHGSAEEYLRAAGVTDEQLGRLRAGLLESAT